MNIKRLEKAERKVCSRCGEWKLLEEYNKRKDNKDGIQSMCRECQKEYRKQYYQNNKEYYKEHNKQYRENNKEYTKELNKQWKENNKEYIKEYKKQWGENNKEHIKQYYQNNKEYYKEYRENNKEHKKEYMKQHYQDNKEYYKEYKKQKYENNKQNNLQYIYSVVERINPMFKELNLPIYGYIYKFENIKTGHKYVGQSINPIKIRYNGSNIIKGWIEERKEKTNQKFLNELIEKDFVVTETLDVAFCQYHLDKLEAYYIDKYDSCNNGYNNNAGYWNRDDGIEEFNQILSDHNLEFKDGKLIQIKNTYRDR